MAHQESRRYLRDVFEGELPPRQAGRAHGGLAHGQPRGPGRLLSSPGQLGRLPSLEVDPAEVRREGEAPTAREACATQARRYPHSWHAPSPFSSHPWVSHS